MNRKKKYFTLFVLLVIATIVAGRYLFQVTSAEHISDSLIRHYQQKYPDLQFSIQSITREFESKLHILGHNFVISKNGQPLVAINRIKVVSGYIDFIRQNILQEIVLEKVELFKSKNVFLEKELDSLFSSLYSLNPLKISWKSVQYMDQFNLGDGRAVTYINKSLEKEMLVEGSLSKVLKYSLSQTHIKFVTSLSQWVRNKELRLKGEIISQESKQRVEFESVLKSSGNARSKVLTSGSLGSGAFSLISTNHNLKVDKLDLILNLNKLSTKLNGQVKLVGSWSLDLKNQEIDSDLKVLGINSLWRNKPLSILGNLNENLELNITGKERDNISFSLKSKLGLNFKDLEYTFYISPSSVMSKSLFDDPIRFVRENFNIAQQYDVNILAEVYYERNLQGEPIQNAQITLASDSQEGQKAMFNMSRLGKGSLSGHYSLHPGSKAVCSIIFKEMPSKFFNQIFSQESLVFFRFDSGALTGRLECSPSGRFKLEGRSVQFGVDFISFNDQLSKIISKNKIHKDHFFSEVQLIAGFKETEIDKIKLRNRKYNITFSNNILDVAGKRLKYKRDIKKKKYIFIEELK